MADDPQEPVPLVRPGGVREAWFDQGADSSGASSGAHSMSMPLSRPSGLFARVSPLRALLSGSIAGVIGGAAFALVPTFIPTKSGAHVDTAKVFGAIVAHDSPDAKVYGVVFCCVVGLLLFALVTLATRHVKKILPIALFGIVFTPIAWLAFQSLLLPRLSHWVAASLPIGPMLVGAASAGLALAIAVPIKK